MHSVPLNLRKRNQLFLHQQPRKNQDRLWTESAVVLDLKPRPKAGAAELIVLHCNSFTFSVVLPESMALQRDDTGSEKQQDVEGKDDEG